MSIFDKEGIFFVRQHLIRAEKAIKEPMQAMTVKLPKGLLGALLEERSKSGWTVAAMVRQALEQFVRKPGDDGVAAAASVTHKELDDRLAKMQFEQRAFFAALVPAAQRLAGEHPATMEEQLDKYLQEVQALTAQLAAVAQRLQGMATWAAKLELYLDHMFGQPGGNAAVTIKAMALPAAQTQQAQGD